MKDTAPWAEAEMARLWRQRSAGERMAAGSGMFHAARILMAAGLLQERNHLTGDALRWRLLERTYAADFEPREWARLRARWERRCGGAGPRQQQAPVDALHAPGHAADTAGEPRHRGGFPPTTHSPRG